VTRSLAAGRLSATGDSVSVSSKYLTQLAVGSARSRRMANSDRQSRCGGVRRLATHLRQALHRLQKVTATALTSSSASVTPSSFLVFAEIPSQSAAAEQIRPALVVVGVGRVGVDAALERRQPRRSAAVRKQRERRSARPSPLLLPLPPSSRRLPRRQRRGGRGGDGERVGDVGRERALGGQRPRVQPRLKEEGLPRWRSTASLDGPHAPSSINTKVPSASTVAL